MGFWEVLFGVIINVKDSKKFVLVLFGVKSLRGVGI